MAYLTIDKQKEIDRKIEDLQLRLGASYPDTNIVSIINSLGIDVYEVDFEGREDINAMLVYKDSDNSDKPTIYIKNGLPPTRKTFTLAHELGHYLLHKKDGVKFRIDRIDYSSNSNDVLEEIEANYFAASFLVNKELLQKLISYFGPNLDYIAKYFGVSKEVIQNRVKWMKMNKI